MNRQVQLFLGGSFLIVSLLLIVLLSINNVKNTQQTQAQDPENVKNSVVLGQFGNLGKEVSKLSSKVSESATTAEVEALKVQVSSLKVQVSSLQTDIEGLVGTQRTIEERDSWQSVHDLKRVLPTLERKLKNHLDMINKLGSGENLNSLTQPMQVKIREDFEMAVDYLALLENQKDRTRFAAVQFEYMINVSADANSSSTIKEIILRMIEYLAKLKKLVGEAKAATSHQSPAYQPSLLYENLFEAIRSEDWALVVHLSRGNGLTTDTARAQTSGQ